MLDIRDFQYYLLPGKCPSHFQDIGLHNKAFCYWRDFWDRFFENNNTPGTIRNRRDDFLRQDIVALITHQEDIIAMHLYTFFNIRSIATLEHSYFSRSFTPEYVEELKRRNVESAISFEWLTVDPEHRKTKSKIPYASTISALGSMVQQATSVDAAVAVSRSDVKVTKIATDLGWDVIVPNVQMHGYPCDLIALFLNNAKKHPIKEVNEMAEYLWNQRIDLTGFTQTKQTRHLKVA